MTNRILVVDDDPDIHAFIRHDLKKSSFEVHSALTTEEAIQLLGQYTFTFALIDIFMGEQQSSHQVIHFLKQDLAGENQNLPIAIMSARMEESYGRKLLLKGPTVFSTLKKPLRPGFITGLLEGRDQASVLAVDDDPDILSLIKRELVKGGYTVFGSLNADQAKKLLRTTDFLAAIVDNKLGVDKDSSDLSKFLEELPSSSQVPLILTGKKINKEVRDNDHLMVFDTIEKPFARGAFLEAVDKIRLWAEKSQGGEDHFSQVISGVTENLTEESQIVTGEETREEDDENTLASLGLLENEGLLLSQLEEVVETDSVEDNQLSSSEENLLVKGSHENSEETTLVSGSLESEEEDIHIEGEREDLGEESTMVKGEKETLKDEVWSVKRLHESGQDDQGPNQRNKKGVTPVMAYCYTGDMEKVKELILEGADLNLKARNGKTCLHYAAYSKNLDLVRMLVHDHNLKINERDEDKREPLYDAMKANDPDMVRTLIQLGARTTSKYDGRNYLSLAVLMKLPQIAKVFFEAGLNPREKDYHGKTALDYAQRNGLKDLWTFLSQESCSA
jgi:DNA-binding response OmpR family regulator